jgi:nitrogenase molybdenum-iron protein alpha chain
VAKNKKINLNITAVESREQRLGTIIAWDGKATDLAKQSSYAARGEERRKEGCSKGGGGKCRICEVKGPFTQGSVCRGSTL